MKRVLIVLGLAGFLAVGACAKDNGVVVKTDRFTGKRCVLMTPFRVGPVMGFRDAQQISETTVSFSLQAAVCDGPSENPFLGIGVIAANWQFLKGADVHVLADGEAIDLGHFASADAHVETSVVVLTVEIVGGSVDRALFERMANAKDLQLKVGVYEIRLNAKNIERLKAFSDAIAKK